VLSFVGGAAASGIIEDIAVSSSKSIENAILEPRGLDGAAVYAAFLRQIVTPPLHGFRLSFTLRDSKTGIEVCRIAHGFRDSTLYAAGQVVPAVDVLSSEDSAAVTVTILNPCVVAIRVVRTTENPVVIRLSKSSHVTLCEPTISVRFHQLSLFHGYPERPDSGLVIYNPLVGVSDSFIHDSIQHCSHVAYPEELRTIENAFRNRDFDKLLGSN
jgi:hypothetical protein